ncbi:acyltransferase [Deinococcus radiomollis]|uniref:acyltransferase n=1 Tax=Deinococcus radiomollis TaxID=468916 RepID=UPI0038916DAD
MTEIRPAPPSAIPPSPDRIGEGQPDTARETANAGQRLEWLDICRGLTIVLVVLHHVTGAGLDHAPTGGKLYFAVLSVNRFTQLVVPTFLFLSALVFALSPLSRFSWRRYLSSRARQLLWPYVLWTALYLGFQIVTGVGPVAGQRLAAFWNPGLLQGKGYFHLYYLLLALQVALLLPFIRALLVRGREQGRRPLRLGWVALGAAALQLGIYLVNLRVWHLNNVGVLSLWYVLPLVLGTALGASPDRFTALWARRKGWLLAACGVAFALYLPSGFAEVLHRPLNVLAYTAGNWAYTVLAALVLSGVSVELLRYTSPLGEKLRHLLGRLGQLSLQVYLLHPMLLWVLDRLPYPKPAALQVLVIVLYTALGVGLPLAFARLIEGRRLSVWLFGR